MSKGQQTETGERDADARAKVVRLPRDWLGPREELVPFGPRAVPLEADVPPTSPVEPPPRSAELLPSADDPLPTDEPPPSPADFWGEQSAAIQSAVEAPAAAEDEHVGSACSQAIRVGGVDRRAVAAVAAVVAIAAISVIAVASGYLGSGGAPQPAGRSKLSFAAVLSGGVSSVLRLDLGRIHVARVATAKVRRTPHRPPAPRPDHKAARPRPTLSARSSTPVVSDAAPATVASSNSYRPTTIDTSDTDTRSETPPATRSGPPRSASQPVASRAAVGATGQSGALGPIQSPNG